MPTALDTITKLIQTPPGQLAAGGALAGIVWKFFERVEALLTENTKLEIAVWLLGVKTADHVPWPETFIKLFDRVFGKKHFSWKCFLRSSVASYGAFGLCLLIAVATHQTAIYIVAFATPPNGSTEAMPFTIPVLKISVLCSLFLNILPDYLSLFVTRIMLAVSKKQSLAIVLFMLVFVDFVLTSEIGSFAGHVGGAFTTKVIANTIFAAENAKFNVHGPLVNPFAINLFDEVKASIEEPLPSKFIRWYCYFPAFFTSVWLWLYAGSGFLLKAARRFDIGFEWFNRKFDIEKKPLQSIGLVSGALVAVMYWSAVILSWVVR